MATQKLYAGAKLREIRTRMSLTQKDFAAKLGVSLPYLNQMENNNRPVSTTVVLALAQEFGVEPAHCVVVEDSIAGIKGGVAAGMRVIGFTGGSHTHPGHADELTDAGAETVVRRLIDIPPIIEVFAEWEGLPA